jgi:hypothetical protein
MIWYRYEIYPESLIASQMASRALIWTNSDDGISVQSLTRACDNRLVGFRWSVPLAATFLVVLCIPKRPHQSD